MSFSVRSVGLDDLSQYDLTAWESLEGRALSANAYLSPRFVLPAHRYLTPGLQPIVVLVNCESEGVSTLVGLAVLVEDPPSLLVPVRGFSCYRSRHSFLGGLLLDRDHARNALDALLCHVQESHKWARIVRISEVAGDILPRTCHWHQRVEGQYRPYLETKAAMEQLSHRDVSQRLRSNSRRLRRLRERGLVEWRWHRDALSCGKAIDAFLALEDTGWKHERRTSLLSNKSDELFFREMIARFASDGRALFTEVTFNGVPIASHCALVSGRIGFSFKVGWDNSFREYSPAWMNEIEFMRQVRECLPDVDYLDSGAAADSYISELWRTRVPLLSYFIPVQPLGTLVVGAMGVARRTKRLARHGKQWFDKQRKGDATSSGPRRST